MYYNNQNDKKVYFYTSIDDYFNAIKYKKCICVVNNMYLYSDERDNSKIMLEHYIYKSIKEFREKNEYVTQIYTDNGDLL